MHGGNLRWAMERYGRDNFIDLSANINPFGPPKSVIQTLVTGLTDIIHYPDPENKELIEALSNHCKQEPEWIIAGNGAGELIFTILQALKPRKVLIPVPSFSEYERAARAVKAEIKTFPLGASGWDLFPTLQDSNSKILFDDVWEKNIEDADLLFLCSPHNPTGSALKREHFERVLEIAKRKNCYVVMDESFYDFLKPEERWSARRYLKDNSHLIVLYSLTKFYSIPGLRLGFAFAHPLKIKDFEKHRDPWSVNVLAQRAGIAALQDKTFHFEVEGKLDRAKEFFYSEFARRSYSKIKLLSSKANFALIKLEERNSSEYVHRLAFKGVLVRDCKNFQGLDGDYIRIAIKDISSMDCLSKALDEVEREWD